MTKNEKKKRGPTLQANISAGINTVVGLGVLIDAHSRGMGDVPWWSFIIVPVIAILLAPTANLGKWLFKMVIPQKDYITRSRMDLLLTEWTATYALPAVITVLIALWLSGTMQ